MEELENIKKQFDELMAKAEEIVKKNEKGVERWRAGNYFQTEEEAEKVAQHFKDYLIQEEAEKVAQHFKDYLIQEEAEKVAQHFKDYLIQEEAEKVAQHFKDYIILRADAKGFEPKDVSLDAHYYFVFWSAANECLETYDDGGSLSGTIYFEDEEEAEKVAQHFKDYLIQEEAEKVAQHFKDYIILRADAKGFEPKDVSLNAHYCFVFWSAANECLETYDDGGSLSGTIYFEDEEDAEASIKKHEDIWKRYLGVEE